MRTRPSLPPMLGTHLLGRLYCTTIVVTSCLIFLAHTHSHYVLLFLARGLHRLDDLVDYAWVRQLKNKIVSHIKLYRGTTGKGISNENCSYRRCVSQRIFLAGQDLA